MNDKLFEKLKGIISEEAPFTDEEITFVTSLKVDLVLDSLDMVELVMVIEEEFGIEIHDEDSERWETVEDMYNYLKRRGKK